MTIPSKKPATTDKKAAASAGKKPAAIRKKAATPAVKKPAAPKKKAVVPGKKAAVLAIEKELIIEAPVEKVWAALADPGSIGAWMDDDSVKVSLKVGGKYAIFGGVTTGKFTVVEKPSVLEYTWRQAEWAKSDPDTIVRWELEPEGKKTRLHLVHGGFVDRHNRDDHAEGWDVYFLEPMKEWLESQ